MLLMFIFSCYFLYNGLRDAERICYRNTGDTGARSSSDIQEKCKRNIKIETRCGIRG